MISLQWDSVDLWHRNAVRHWEQNFVPVCKFQFWIHHHPHLSPKSVLSCIPSFTEWEYCHPVTHIRITGVNYDSLLAFTSSKPPSQFYLFVFLKSVNAFMLIFTLNTLPQVSIISHQDYCSSLLAGLPLVFSPRLFSHWCRSSLTVFQRAL